MTKHSEESNEGAGEAQLPTERSESGKTIKSNNKAAYSQPSSPKPPKTNRASYGKHVYVLCSACHHLVPLLGSWVQVGAWGMLTVVEDTGGTPRGLVSGGVLHATTEDAPPPCVSLGPSGPKTPHRGPVGHLR